MQKNANVSLVGSSAIRDAQMKLADATHHATMQQTNPLSSEVGAKGVDLITRGEKKNPQPAQMGCSCSSR